MAATKKGVAILERGSQVHFRAEFQELLDFPPAPKLRWDGKLDPAKASPSEVRGQEVFFGKGQCAVCHPGPYFTDGSAHNLRTERFFAPPRVNGASANHNGPPHTSPLRGLTDPPTLRRPPHAHPPHRHDRAREPRAKGRPTCRHSPPAPSTAGRNAARRFACLASAR